MGTACSSGIGFAAKSLWHGLPIIRAHLTATDWRALSVAIPVLAYIWQYSFDISRKASRERSVGTQRDLRQILARL